MCDYFHFAMSIASADGLATLDARTSVRGILLTTLCFFWSSWYFGGKEVAIWRHPVCALLFKLQTIWLSSLCEVCISEYGNAYMPTTDWLRRCWCWPRGIMYGSINENIMEMWTYLIVHYVMLEAYRCLLVSWTKHDFCGDGWLYELSC